MPSDLFKVMILRTQERIFNLRNLIFRFGHSIYGIKLHSSKCLFLSNMTLPCGVIKIRIFLACEHL